MGARRWYVFDFQTLKRTAMKLAIHTFVILLLIGLGFSARGQLEYSLRTGIQINDVSVKGAGSFAGELPKSMTGTFAYLESDIPVSGNFSVLSGLGYTRKGFSVREDFNVDVLGLDLPVGARVLTKLDFIELPLMGKMEWGEGPVKFQAGMGPYIAYAFNGKLDPKASLFLEFDLPDIDINLDNNLYNRWDAGLAGMLGASYSFGSGSAFIEGRYQHGLTDMLDEPLLDIRVKNRAVQLGLGLRFQF